MRRYARRFFAVTAVTALLTAAACTGDDDSANGETNGEEVVLDEVTYLTGFGNFGREAFAWVALDKGYFEEEGLDVTIEIGQGAGDNVGLVTSGQAEFAQADFTGLMLLWGEEAARDFVAFATVHQRTLTGIMALESSGITGPEDLEGRTVGDFLAGSVNYFLFPTYAELAGIDASQVEWENAPPQELAGVLAGGVVDAVGQFMVGQPLIENVGGEPAVTLPYSDYLTDLYGAVLITSTEIAESDPDMVQRFSRALLRGLEYSVDNPGETGEILAQYQDAQPAEVAAAEAELLEAYVRPLNPGEPFGVLDEQRVAQSIAVLEAAGAIPAGVVPEDLVNFDLTPSN